MEGLFFDVFELAEDLLPGLGEYNIWSIFGCCFFNLGGWNWMTAYIEIDRIFSLCLRLDHVLFRISAIFLYFILSFCDLNPYNQDTNGNNNP